MTLETAFLYVIAGGLLLAHLATLRLLLACRTHAADFAESMTGQNAEVGFRMEEVCRIGSDIADLLEGVVDSGILAKTEQVTEAVGELDLKSTLASLILSRVMGANDGSTPEQEGSIYGTNQTQNQSTSTQDDNPPEE